MYMCTREVSDITVIADFTGTPDFFSNPNFIIGFNKMVSLYDTILISTNSISLIEGNRVIQEISSEIEINTENIFMNLELHEADTIVITNNKDKIKSWIDINVSVLFIEEREEEQLILNNNYMPDAIWSIDQFANDIENLNSNLYYMEHIGEEYVRGAMTYYKLPLYNEYAQVEYDTVFLGRYFKVQDGRHYIHPLSRTILDFKSIVRGDRILASRQVIFEYLNYIIKHFIDQSQDITHITAVPPRPNQQHRFYGFEQFYDGTVPLGFQLLETTRPYESPKYSRGAYEKYQCVEGVFECTENIQGHVLLIDDIFTSGSTVSECVRVLERNGADKVTVIPLAHTQYLPASDFKWLDGKFDDNGNEYKLKIKKKDGSAFWVREDGHILNHNEVVKYYNDQNRYEINNEPPYTLNCDENEIQGILFDLDDTLIETGDLEGYRRNYRELTSEIILENSMPLIGVELVNELKRRGLKIGVVTRSREEYAKLVLDTYGYEYDVLISRYSTYRTKPHQDPYVSCAKKMLIDPINLISIGNEDVDTISSNKAGIYCYEIGDNISIEEVIRLLNSILELRLIG